MTAVTAEELTIMRIRKPDDFWSRKGGAPPPIAPPQPRADSLESNQLGVVSGPTTIAAPWFGDVERRIRDSIARPDDEFIEDGSHITGEVGSNAIRFFRATSDLWPIEPYLYASPAGDLVADFKVSPGTITTIVNASSYLVFTAIDGLIEKHLLEMTSDLRSEIGKLMENLLTAPHGTVDS